MSDEANRAADAAEAEYHKDKAAGVYDKTPAIKMPEPRAWKALQCHIQPPIYLCFQRDTLMLYKGVPVSLFSGDVVYFPDSNLDRAHMRIINAFEPDAIHIRCQASEFDFMVGALLTRVGVGLTKGDLRDG